MSRKKPTPSTPIADESTIQTASTSDATNGASNPVVETAATPQASDEPAPSSDAPATSTSDAAPVVDDGAISHAQSFAPGDSISKEPIPMVADGIEREVFLGTGKAQEQPEAQEQEPLPDEVTLKDGRTFYATKAWLPNTCYMTGEKCTDRWFAIGLDAARSGQGVCEAYLRSLLEAEKESGD